MCVVLGRWFFFLDWWLLRGRGSVLVIVIVIAVSVGVSDVDVESRMLEAGTSINEAVCDAIISFILVVE